MKLPAFSRLRRKPRPAPGPRRILAEAAVLFALHFALLQVFARVDMLHHLLSPGADATAALAATAFFLLLRLFVIVFGAAWLATRLWLWWTRPAKDRAPATGDKADAARGARTP